MQIHMTARHCDLGNEFREFAQQRIEKLGKYARDIQEVHFVLTHDKNRHSAELALKVKHHELVAREEAHEALEAFTLAVDHLEEQLRRLKERRLDRKQRTGGGRQLNGTAGEADADAKIDGVDYFHED